MDGEESDHDERAYMIEGYYGAQAADHDDEVNWKDIVVIGEGEDHRYCEPETSCSRSSNYEPYWMLENSMRSHRTTPYRKRKGLKPPKLRNFFSVFVKCDRTWKFQTATVVGTCGENGQLFYHPDPFSPAPPFRGAPSAVERMEFAARRLDNRKYRNQYSKVLASDKLDSATCSKCKLRFFLPFRYFKNRITYRVPENPYLLPMPRFCCPLCEQDSPIEL
ncbi:hypothetical protein Q1695_015072 [Nippostrongylus brasiliensis]|nr:hypothetical protein Q1695_015072 [Nippostrongylus brasiliensis]